MPPTAGPRAAPITPPVTQMGTARPSREVADRSPSAAVATSAAPTACTERAATSIANDGTKRQARDDATKTNVPAANARCGRRRAAYAAGTATRASTRLKEVRTHATVVMPTSNCVRMSGRASVTMDESASARATASPKSCDLTSRAGLPEPSGEHLDQRNCRSRIRPQRSNELPARDGKAPHISDGMDVGDAPPAGIEHLDLTDELAGSERQAASWPLDAYGSLDDEQELRARLADSHDRLPVRVLPLAPECQDRVEQLPRQRGENVGMISDETLVPAAVEEQRLAFSVAGELDLPEEERVVAAPVRADHPRDEVGERPLDKRRIVDQLEQRLGCSLDRAPCEVIRKRRLARLEHVHSDPRPLVQQLGHPRAPVDGDKDERRLQRDGHERIRGHAVHYLALPCREPRHPGGEHPARSAEGDRRVALESHSELELVERRRRLEGRAERLGSRDRALDRNLELLGDRRALHQPGS